MKVKCPRCGSNNVCEILYGMATGEAFELAEQGKLILGGCDIIMDDLPQPDYGCLDCKFEWAPEMLLPSDIVKIRFKVWTSTECSGESQKYMIYEMFQDGLIRIYQYIGKSRKAVTKETKQTDANEVSKLSAALQKELKTPFAARERREGESAFNLQITYIDWRKIVVDSEDDMAGEFWNLMKRFVEKL